jgi:hypothetical protein
MERLPEETGHSYSLNIFWFFLETGKKKTNLQSAL